MKSAEITYATFESPVGTFVLAALRGRLTQATIMTPDGRYGPSQDWRRSDADLAGIREQFAAYFAGELTSFDLPLELRGSPFQLRAWSALQKVPFGSTTTYSDLAAAIGAPRAARAIGLAMNRNPIALALPCHRVVGRDGSLCGYLNGIALKQRLIAFEAARCRARSRLSWTEWAAASDLLR